MKTFSTLTTCTGEEIKISSNNSKRTYTIQTETTRYRTYPMSVEEYNDCYYNTGNDWRDFLKSDDYYKVK